MVLTCTRPTRSKIPPVLRRRRTQGEQGVEPWTGQGEPPGDVGAEPDAAPTAPEVDVAEAAGLLTKAVADLDSLVGKDQLDMRARISQIEDRIGRLEQLVGGLLGEEDPALGPSSAGEAASVQARPAGDLGQAPRRKKVKRDRVKRRALAPDGLADQVKDAPATQAGQPSRGTEEDGSEEELE